MLSFSGNFERASKDEQEVTEETDQRQRTKGNEGNEDGMGNEISAIRRCAAEKMNKR